MIIYTTYIFIVKIMCVLEWYSNEEIMNVLGLYSKAESRE